MLYFIYFYCNFLFLYFFYLFNFSFFSIKFQYLIFYKNKDITNAILVKCLHNPIIDGGIINMYIL